MAKSGSGESYHGSWLYSRRAVTALSTLASDVGSGHEPLHHVSHVRTSRASTVLPLLAVKIRTLPSAQKIPGAGCEAST